MKMGIMGRMGVLRISVTGSPKGLLVHYKINVSFWQDLRIVDKSRREV